MLQNAAIKNGARHGAWHQVVLIASLLIVPLIFSHATTDVYGMVKVAAIELFAVVLLIVPGTSARHRAWHQISLFFLIACISLIRPTNVYAGLQSLYLLAAYLVIFFIIVRNIATVDDARQLISAAIVAGVFACTFSIYQNKGLNFSTTRFVYTSTFGNPIFFSQYLSAIVPLSLAMALQKRAKRDIKRFLKPAFYLIVASLSILLLILARSRGAYLGLLAAAIYIYAVILVTSQERARKIILRISALMIIMAIAVSAALWPKLRQDISSRQLQNMMRIHVWQSTVNMIKAHPVLGVGVGNFEYVYPLYRTKEEKQVTPKGVKYTAAHNEILQVWAEMGIFGLLAFLGILFYGFRGPIASRGALRLPYKSRSDETSRRILVIGIKSALISLLIQSLFNPMLTVPTSGLLFWVLLALVGRDDKFRELDWFPKPIVAGRLRKAAKGLACFAVAILAPVHILKPLISDHFLEKAQVSEAESDLEKTLSYLKRSLKAYPHNWEALFMSGKIYQNMRSFKEAIDSYEKAARYHPNYATIWNNLGTACIQGDKIDHAIKAFSRTIEIDDGYIGAHYNLSLAYEKAGQAKLAEAEIEKVRAIDPAFLGNMYLESNIFDEAALEFHKAIRRDPNNIEAHFKLGQIWDSRNESEKAINMYTRAVELAPFHLDAHIALGDLYRKEKKLDEAVSSYEAALRATPEEMNKLYRDISFYSDIGIYAQALAKYEEIDDVEKKEIDVRRKLASIYKSRGETRKAIAEYSKLTDMLPSDISIWEELASLYEKDGLYEEAKDAYSKVIEINPQDEETLNKKISRLNRIASHHALAVIYEKEEMFEKVASEYKKALDFDKDNIFIMRRLGESYVKSAKFSEAEDIFRKIIEIAPQDASGHISLGDLFYQRGELRAAEAEYTRTIEISPYDSRGPLSLAGLYRREGRLDEAKAIYEKAISISPRDVKLRLSMATLMEEMLDVDRAKKEYREVLSIEPENKEARIRLEALEALR